MGHVAHFRDFSGSYEAYLRQLPSKCRYECEACRFMRGDACSWIPGKGPRLPVYWRVTFTNGVNAEPWTFPHMRDKTVTGPFASDARTHHCGAFSPKDKTDD